MNVITVGKGGSYDYCRHESTVWLKYSLVFVFISQFKKLPTFSHILHRISSKSGLLFRQRIYMIMMGLMKTFKPNNIKSVLLMLLYTFISYGLYVCFQLKSKVIPKRRLYYFPPLFASFITTYFKIKSLNPTRVFILSTR